MNRREINSTKSVDSVFTRNINNKYNTREVRECSDKVNYTSKTIWIILNVCSWLGVTLKKPLNEGRRICSLSLWDSLSMLSAIVTYIISIIGIHILNITPRILFTIYAYFTLGFLIRITILTKRNKMFTYATSICDMCTFLNVDNKRHFQRVKICVSIFCVWLLIIAVTFSYFLATVETSGFHWCIFGFKIDIHKIPVFIYAVRLSATYSGIISTGIIFIALIICCSTYKLADSMMKSFSENFGKHSASMIFSKSTVISLISTYRQLLTICKDIDNVISGMTFFLYAASVTCFFNTVSLILSDTFLTDISMIVQVIINLAMALLIFFSLTYTGESVHSNHENLKMLMIEGVEKIFNVTEDYHMMSIYGMFIESVNNINIYFTGADMFQINKSLILTTAGAMLTYGVIIFQ